MKEYNFQFRQRRKELKNLPHISVPDLPSQIEQHVKRLYNIRRALLQKLTPNQSTDPNHLMELAGNADAVEKRMSLILEYTALHTDSPMKDTLQASKSHKSAAVTQKCAREHSSGKSTEVQAFPFKGKAGRPWQGCQMHR